MCAISGNTTPEEVEVPIRVPSLACNTKEELA
jgi:hypothetical protein